MEKELRVSRVCQTCTWTDNIQIWAGYSFAECTTKVTTKSAGYSLLPIFIGKTTQDSDKFVDVM